MPRLKELQTGPYLLITGLSVAIFVAGALVASSRQLIGAELDVFNFIYGWPEWLRPLMWTITQLGSVWMAMAAVAVYWWQDKRPLALRLLVGSLAGYALVGFLKQVVDRPRPYELQDGVLAHDIISPGLGFPSGHTAIGTILALTIQPYLPKRWRWVVWPVILLIGISRVYLGVHSPLDVVGGLAVGVVVVYTTRYLHSRVKL